MNRFLAVIACFAFFIAACGVDRESEDSLAEDVDPTSEDQAEADGSDADSDEGAEDDAAATPTTLPPVSPPTTGAPADVALSAEFTDAEWEITHGELNEVVVPTQENEEFVALIFGGVQPAGFDAGVLTEHLISRAIGFELDAIGSSVSDEQREESRASLLAQVETLFVGVPDATSEAERLFDEVPYLPFLVEYQAGQNALSEALAEEAGPGLEVPCVRHILVDEEAEGDAAIVRLEAGEDFATLAQELSTGPSGPAGGDLGCSPSSNYVPAFAEAVDTAEIGAFVGPVQTEFGWHVILVEGVEAQPADGRALATERLRGRLGEATIDVDANLGSWNGDQLAIVPLGS